MIRLKVWYVGEEQPVEITSEDIHISFDEEKNVRVVDGGGFTRALIPKKELSSLYIMGEG